VPIKDPGTLSCNVHPSAERWSIHKAASTTLAVPDAGGHVGTKCKVGHCPLCVYPLSPVCLPLSTRWHAWPDLTHAAVIRDWNNVSNSLEVIGD